MGLTSQQAGWTSGANAGTLLDWLSRRSASWSCVCRSSTASVLFLVFSFPHEHLAHFVICLEERVLLLEREHCLGNPSHSLDII